MMLPGKKTYQITTLTSQLLQVTVLCNSYVIYDIYFYLVHYRHYNLPHTHFHPTDPSVQVSSLPFVFLLPTLSGIFVFVSIG
jgi:hypothetical protein